MRPGGEIFIDFLFDFFKRVTRRKNFDGKVWSAFPKLHDRGPAGFGPR